MEDIKLYFDQKPLADLIGEQLQEFLKQFLDLGASSAVKYHLREPLRLYLSQVWHVSSRDLEALEKDDPFAFQDWYVFWANLMSAKPRGDGGWDNKPSAVAQYAETTKRIASLLNSGYQREICERVLTLGMGQLFRDRKDNRVQEQLTKLFEAHESVKNRFHQMGETVLIGTEVLSLKEAVVRLDEVAITRVEFHSEIQRLASAITQLDERINRLVKARKRKR